MTINIRDLLDVIDVIDDKILKGKLNDIIDRMDYENDKEQLSGDIKVAVNDFVELLFNGLDSVKGGVAVGEGDDIKCICGKVPTPLIVTSPTITLKGKKLATINDNQPNINIVPFIWCNLAQKPCMPLISQKWKGIPGVVGVGHPTLTAFSFLKCDVGGVILINRTLQTTISIGKNALNAERIRRDIKELEEEKEELEREEGR